MIRSDPLLKYFRWRVAGDDYVSRLVDWGRSAIYFETSEEGFVSRQIQLFESGIVLTYDEDHSHDEHGWLYLNPVYSDPPRTVAVTSKAFNEAWMRHTVAKNREYKNNA
jgi:hypothetical protein